MHYMLSYTRDFAVLGLREMILLARHRCLVSWDQAEECSWISFDVVL